MLSRSSPCLLTFHLLLICSTTVIAQLVGKDMRCPKSDEGKVVKIPGIDQFPCIKCICQTGIVVCRKSSCASLEGCHLVKLQRPPGACCQLCTGCALPGHRWASSSRTWPDSLVDVRVAASSRCGQLQCHAAVLTRSIPVCHTPCEPARHLAPRPGDCCGRCIGCTVNGRTLQEGESSRPLVDRCVICTCKLGLLKCVKEVCPVANCEPRFQIREQCCVKCKGKRQLMFLGSYCFFQGHVHRDGASWTADECTRCSCHNGTSLCTRQTCPVLGCAAHDYLSVIGECCPRCSVRRACLVPDTNVVHSDGTSWLSSKDPCRHCTCRDGVTQCSRKNCPNAPKQCPLVSELVRKSGKCCYTCVERYRSCAVFGDPHLRTFDRRIITFSGQCKYVISRQCGKSSAFQIQFKYDKSERRRRIFIKYYRFQLQISHGYKIRLNGRKLKTPVRQSDMFSVNIIGYFIELTLKNGFKVVWDGTSYLEIHAPVSYRSKLCGLCGNYNGKMEDDVVGPKGEMYASENEFADSWRKGFCKSLHSKPPVCLLTRRQRRLVRRYCAIIIDQKFRHCRRKLDLRPYYNWCVERMCQCSSSTSSVSRCVCPVFKTVLKKCRRRTGEYIPLENVPCRLAQHRMCAQGQRYKRCACPLRCRDLGHNRRCRRCRPGCECRGRRLLLHGHCVRLSDCPRRFLRRFPSNTYK